MNKRSFIGILCMFLFCTLLLGGCELVLKAPEETGVINIVCIGQDYKNNDIDGDNLDGTINDASAVFSVLSDIAAELDETGQEYLLIPSYDEGKETPFPTLQETKDILTDLQDTANQADLTIFMYSGHGEKSSGNLLFPNDGSSIGIYQRFSSTDLLQEMNAIPGRKLLLLDSCFSGNFVEDEETSTSTVYDHSIADYYAQYFSDATYEIKNMYVISASRNDQESYEPPSSDAISPSHIHGYFSYALLQGLGETHKMNEGGTIGSPPAARNGIVSVDSLYQYIKSHQQIPFKTSLFWISQHPMTNGGPMDMVLFDFSTP